MVQKNFFSRKGFSEAGTGMMRGSSRTWASQYARRSEAAWETFTLSMQASIFSCSTAFLAWEMLVVLLLDMPSFIPALPAERWYRYRSRQGTLQQKNLAVRREADSGSGCGVPRSRRAAGAAQMRAGSPAWRSTGTARPSGIARPGLCESAPCVATRGVPDHRGPARLGRKGGNSAEPKPQQSHPQAGLRVCAAGPRGARR